jgi:serine/threonine protein kinase
MPQPSYAANEDSDYLTQLRDLEDIMIEYHLNSWLSPEKKRQLLTVATKTDVDLIGSGGFGDVFGLTFGGHDLAVKVPRVVPGQVDTSYVELVALERLAEMSLKRPVGLLIPFVFLSGGDQVYMTMRRGMGSLQQLMDEGLDFSTDPIYGNHLIQGLTALHREGLVHRDLKPANIIGFRNESKGGILLQITDFGATTSLGGSSYVTNQTTPDYRAPESFVAGKRWKGNLSYDIWALGCVGFYISAGEHLFSSLSEVVGKQNNAYQMLALHVGCIGRPGNTAALRWSPGKERHLASLVRRPSCGEDGVEKRMREVVQARNGKEPHGLFWKIMTGCVQWEHGTNSRPKDALELQGLMKPFLADSAEKVQTNETANHGRRYLEDPSESRPPSPTLSPTPSRSMSPCMRRSPPPSPSPSPSQSPTPTPSPTPSPSVSQYPYLYLDAPSACKKARLADRQWSPSASGSL